MTRESRVSGGTTRVGRAVACAVAWSRAPAAARSEQAPPAPATPPAPAEGPVRTQAPSATRGVRDWFGRPAREGAPRRWQRQKSARLAMLSSFVVPGLGQLYNERELWAVVAAGVEFYFLGNAVIEQRETNRYRALVHADLDSIPGETEEMKQLRRERLRADREVFQRHRATPIPTTPPLWLSPLPSGLPPFPDAHPPPLHTSPPPPRAPP